ncbi:hypothetical protein CAPTEDRAFT_215418 [Capitella teleta]|uniref:Sulfotransferase domain-containing protein n=1 Tax=Capitella teleta TaxID=283909 RepID=R7T8X6_CAPTE|nr:hypothetical protein CAPTEDRAFT_215418 [Capitella teleta]|eukprot:ELT90154.1 hypothetical protein CAPTEDRAFT_215418 [Capitella teleta]
MVYTCGQYVGSLSLVCLGFWLISFQRILIFRVRHGHSDCRSFAVQTLTDPTLFQSAAVLERVRSDFEGHRIHEEYIANTNDSNILNKVVLENPYDINSRMDNMELTDDRPPTEVEQEDAHDITPEMDKMELTDARPATENQTTELSNSSAGCLEMNFSRERPFIHTALASYQGAGNTWLRHLIEVVTGFYTGSIYREKHLLTQFKGEMRDSGVIAVKTHNPGDTEKYRNFQRSILLYRSPENSIAADFNRQLTGKTGVLSKEAFEDVIKYCH